MLLDQQEKKKKEEEQSQFIIQNILNYTCTTSEDGEDINCSKFQANSQYRKGRISSAAIRKCSKGYENNHQGALDNCHM